MCIRVLMDNSWQQKNVNFSYFNLQGKPMYPAHRISSNLWKWTVDRMRAARIVHAQYPEAALPQSVSPSWRRSFTTVGTWRARGGWRSRAHCSSVKRRSKCSKTGEWNRSKRSRSCTHIQDRKAIWNYTLKRRTCMRSPRRVSAQCAALSNMRKLCALPYAQTLVGINGQMTDVRKK